MRRIAHAVVVVVLCDQIALPFDIRLCIAHRNGQAGVVQHRAVVIGVADADCLRHRDMQIVRKCLQAAALRDALRRHLQCSLLRHCKGQGKCPELLITRMAILR